MNEINLPKNASIATKVIEAQHTNRKMELGIMGKVFGGGAEKSGNIAGFVLVFSFLAVLILLWLAATYPTAKLTEAIAGFFTIITTTVGYIFGRNSSN